jgi:hypothetical protein
MASAWATGNPRLESSLERASVGRQPRPAAAEASDEQRLLPAGCWAFPENVGLGSPVPLNVLQRRLLANELNFHRLLLPPGPESRRASLNEVKLPVCPPDPQVASRLVASGWIRVRAPRASSEPPCCTASCSRNRLCRLGLAAAADVNLAFSFWVSRTQICSTRRDCCKHHPSGHDLAQNPPRSICRPSSPFTNLHHLCPSIRSTRNRRSCR